MKLFFGFCGVFAIYLFCFILTITDNKKHPPFIEKGKTGKKNRECYSVFVWTVVKGAGSHHQYDFVKRKNGKYRLKFYPVLEWFTGVLLLSFYIWMIDDHWDSIMKYPEMEIPFLLGLFLMYLGWWATGNDGSIIARIYFHKYMKTQTKGKRR